MALGVLGDDDSVVHAHLALGREVAEREQQLGGPGGLVERDHDDLLARVVGGLRLVGSLVGHPPTLPTDQLLVAEAYFLTARVANTTVMPTAQAMESHTSLPGGRPL